MKKFLLLFALAMLWSPAAFANSVSFYFQDGEEDDFELMYPSSFVSIWNDTADELVSVPADMAFMSFDFTNTTLLKIYPNDLDYELVVKVEGDTDGYNLDKEDGEWYLTLFPEADDLEIYVQVYLAGQAPGGDETKEVSISFIMNAAQGSSIDNPGEQVVITYFDRTTFQDITLTAADNNAACSVVPGTSFTVNAKEGYIITDIMTFNDDIVSVSAPGEGNEWYVSVAESPAGDFASLFVTVDTESSDEPIDPFAARISHITPLRWMIQWPEYVFISQLDTDYFENNIILTDESGKSTILLANLHGRENTPVIFPESGNFFTINLENLNLANGTYKLTIPEGYVELGSERIKSPIQFFDIEIGSDVPELSHIPAFSEIKDNFFDISWENVTSLAEGTTSGAYLRDMMTDETYPLYFLEDFNYSQANIRIFHDYMLRVNITVNYPNLPAGYYSLYMPANYVLFNGTTSGNDEIDGYEFTYIPAWNEGEIVFDGPTTDDIITVTWVDATEVVYNTEYKGDGQGIRGITLFDGKNQQINLDYLTEVTLADNKMTINLADIPIEEGECTLLIPEGCLLVTVFGETDYNFETQYFFKYGEGSGDDNPSIPQYTGQPTWSIQTGDTVTGGTLIEVGWEDYTLEFIPGADLFSIHNPATGILDLEYGTQVTLSEDKTRILIDINSFPSYTYRVNVPEACVYLDIDGKQYFNTATSMDGVILSVSAIESETGHYRVINLQGIVVMDTDNRSDLNNLPSGVYIVNGKKVRI